MAFAAIFVERAVRVAEQRRSLRFRAVQALMGLVSYALKHDVYFDGGASNYLEMEWDALQRRQEQREKVLWSNEVELCAAAHGAAFAFMEEALKFARAVDDLTAERSRLRVDLRPPFSDWAAVAALDDNMKAAFRRVPIRFERPSSLTADNLLNQADWRTKTTALKGAWPAMSDRLDEYFNNDNAILAVRVSLLNKFFAFQDAAIAFRDRVWESDNPDA